MIRHDAGILNGEHLFIEEMSSSTLIEPINLEMHCKISSRSSIDDEKSFLQSFQHKEKKLCFTLVSETCKDKSERIGYASIDYSEADNSCQIDFVIIKASLPLFVEVFTFMLTLSQNRYEASSLWCNVITDLHDVTAESILFQFRMCSQIIPDIDELHPRGYVLTKRIYSNARANISEDIISQLSNEERELVCMECNRSFSFSKTEQKVFNDRG